MSNTLKILCLAILPSLSFAAADQTASSPNLSGYQLTQKILTTYFRTVSSFGNSVTTTPDNAKITVLTLSPKDIVVDFSVVSRNTGLNDFAPGFRKDLLTAAIIETLDKKISETETWLSWLARPLTGYKEEHWLDDGIACKYIKGSYDKNYQISCRGSISRELFDAMKKNAEKFEAMKQQQDQAPCTPSVAVNTPESKPLATNPAPASTINNDKKFNDFLKQQFEKGLKKTSPDQAAVSEELIKQLVRSGQYTARQQGTTTQLSFAFSTFSDKMRGYAENEVKNDISKYGNNKIPPHVLSRCAGDMECSLTWFFWWNLHNTQSHSGEYYLKNGCVLKSFGAARGGPSGNVEMPTELFESMKQEAASKASE